ncbi:hypothetical protein C0992_011016 [Termitomyces sp. T32_za158]|nr:hypothetical protein C0992_011016 [Termitomyces sp. T32_za158]
MRYRIIDTALFKDGNARLRVPMIRRDLEGIKIPSLTKLRLGKLKDVKEFILHAKKLIRKASSTVPASDVPIGSPPADSHKISERLFTSICKRSRERATENIFLNFETAAFHLKFLLEGHPDLPTNTEDLKKYFREKNNTDNQIWDFSRKNIFELKGPLYIAMAISPLLLLSSKNLQKNPPGKEALFNFWCISGQYERPRSVLSAEKELWNVVWDIAAGMDTYHRLQTAIDRLLELDFEDVGEWELTENYPTKPPQRSGSSSAKPHDKSSQAGGSATAIIQSSTEHQSSQGAPPSSSPNPKTIEGSEPPESADTELIAQGSTQGQGFCAPTISSSDIHVQIFESTERSASTGTEMAAQDSSVTFQSLPDGIRQSTPQRGGSCAALSARDVPPQPKADADASATTPNPPPTPQSLQDDTCQSTGDVPPQPQADADASATTQNQPPPTAQSTQDSRSCITPTLSLDKRRPERMFSANNSLIPPGSQLAIEFALAEQFEADMLVSDAMKIDQMFASQLGPGPDTENDQSDDSHDDDDIIFLGIVKPKKVILQREVNLLDLASSPSREKKPMGRINIHDSPPKIVGPTPLCTMIDDRSSPVVGLPTTHVIFFTGAILPSLTHLQFKTDLDWIYDIHGSAVSADNRSTSIVHISYQEYKSMDPKKIGRLFSKTSILVTGVPVGATAPNYPSFTDALKSLGRMDKDIVMEDQSINLLREQAIQGPGGLPGLNRSFIRHKVGTLKDILQSLDAERPKSLKALGIPPCVSKPADHHPLFTDRVAWDNAGAKSGKSYPENEMRWSRVATSWAHQKWHLNSDGFATFIQVDFGMLLYFIGNPKRNLPRNLLPGGIDRFLGKFDLERTNSDILDIEFVILQPGDLLLVRPTTLHAVVNVVPTVVRGGHFYATSTIRATCYGIYDNFVTGSYATNTSHAAASNSLLSRLLDFYYRELVHGEVIETDRRSIDLPDLRNFQEVVDIFTLLHLIELVNVISNWNYRDSSTPGAVENRLGAIKNRKLARQIKKWYFARYLLEGLESHLTAEEVLNHRFLAQQAKALSNYKRHAWEKRKGQDGDQGITAEGHAQTTPEMVDTAIHECLIKTPAYLRYINALSEVCTFGWDGPEYVSRMRDDVIGPTEITSSYDEVLYMSGLTFGDICFFQNLNQDEDQEGQEDQDMFDDEIRSDLEWRPQRRKRATTMDGSRGNTSRILLRLTDIFPRFEAS